MCEDRTISFLVSFIIDIRFAIQRNKNISFIKEKKNYLHSHTFNMLISKKGRCEKRKEMTLLNHQNREGE